MSASDKVIKCRAAIAWKTNEPLKIEEIEVAPPKAGEVRIKVLYTALCHTDIHSLEGKVVEGVSSGRFPVIFGHEGAGIVESVGEGVESLKPGDHVIPCFIPQCHKCKYCKTNKTNLCLAIRETQERGEMPDGTSRFTCRGEAIAHYMGCSTFSEYTVCAEISVARINPDAPLDKICLFGCGFCTGYGAALNDSKIQPNSTVGVWGLGGVGMAAVIGAKTAGARQIVGIDLSDERLENSKKFGVTDTINPKRDVPNGVSIQKYLTDRFDGGFDYTLECVGNVDIMRQALESAHEGWGVSCIVGVANKGAEICFEPAQLLSGRRWVGSFYGGWKSRDSLPKLVDDYMKGIIPLDALISHRYLLPDINKAFNHMHAGEGYRTVIALASVDQ